MDPSDNMLTLFHQTIARPSFISTQVVYVPVCVFACYNLLYAVLQSILKSLLLIKRISQNSLAELTMFWREALFFRNKNSSLASGSGLVPTRDRTLKVWNANVLSRSLRTLVDHSDYVKALANVPNGVDSGALDGRVPSFRDYSENGMKVTKSDGP